MSSRENKIELWQINLNVTNCSHAIHPGISGKNWGSQELFACRESVVQSKIG